MLQMIIKVMRFTLGFIFIPVPIFGLFMALADEAIQKRRSDQVGIILDRYRSEFINGEYPSALFAELCRKTPFEYTLLLVAVPLALALTGFLLFLHIWLGENFYKDPLPVYLAIVLLCAFVWWEGERKYRSWSELEKIRSRVKESVNDNAK